MKQDIIPGMVIPLHFQADQIGVYEIPAPSCGLGHFEMRTTLQVMSDQDSRSGSRNKPRNDAFAEVILCPLPRMRRTMRLKASSESTSSASTKGDRIQYYFWVCSPCSRHGAFAADAIPHGEPARFVCGSRSGPPPRLAAS
jgi:hypothetical protein